jgi:AcrR family transcriptional regulator
MTVLPARPAWSSRPDAELRSRVVDAVIECAKEWGLQAATPEAISSKAGVAWREIKARFGDRQQLLLVVLEHEAERLTNHLGTARVRGDTIEDRLNSLAELMAAFYDDARYLVLVQIQSDLCRDPRIAKAARAQMKSLQTMTGPLFQGLVDDVFDKAVRPAEEFPSLLYFALTGMALSHALHALMPESSVAETTSDWAAQRRLLAMGLSAVYRDLAVGKPSRPSTGTRPHR